MDRKLNAPSDYKPVQYNDEDNYLEWEVNGFYEKNVLEMVPISLLPPYPRTKETETRPKSISWHKKQFLKTGICDPVELYMVKGVYGVNDGHHRIEAARQLGYSHIPAVSDIKCTDCPVLQDDIPRIKFILKERSVLLEVAEKLSDLLDPSDVWLKVGYVLVKNKKMPGKCIVFKLTDVDNGQISLNKLESEDASAMIDRMILKCDDVDGVVRKITNYMRKR